MQWDKVAELERKARGVHEESRGAWGPGKRYGHTLNVVQGGAETAAFVIGGTIDARKQTLGVCKYDADKESWKRPKLSGPAPAVRENHTCTTVGSRLFIFGGRNSEATLGDLFILETETNQWLAPQTVGELPAPREGHAAALLGKAIHIFGGCMSSESDDKNDVFYDDCFMLDTETLRWQWLETVGERPRARTGLSMVAWKSCLVVFGGQDVEEDSLSDIHILNTETSRWSKLQTHGKPPAPRAGHVCTVVGDQLIVFGGVNKQDQKVFNDVNSLDFVTSTWRPQCARGTFPRHRFSAAAALIDDRGGDLLMYGGCDQDLAATSGFFVLLTGVGQSGSDVRRLRKHLVRASSSEGPLSKKRKTIIPTLSGHRATVDPETAALYFQTISRIAQKLGVTGLAPKPEANGHHLNGAFQNGSQKVAEIGNESHASQGERDVQTIQDGAREAAVQASVRGQGDSIDRAAGPSETGEKTLLSSGVQIKEPVKKLVPIRKGTRPLLSGPSLVVASGGSPRAGAVESREVENATESSSPETEATGEHSSQPQATVTHSVGTGTEHRRVGNLAASNKDEVTGSVAASGQQPSQVDSQMIGVASLSCEASDLAQCQAAKEAVGRKQENEAPCSKVTLAQAQPAQQEGYREGCTTAVISQSTSPAELSPCLEDATGVKELGAASVTHSSPPLEASPSNMLRSDEDTLIQAQASTVGNGSMRLHRASVEAIQEEGSSRPPEGAEVRNVVGGKHTAAENGTVEASMHEAFGGWVSLNMPDVREDPPEEMIDLKIEALLQTGFSVSAQVDGQQLRGFLYSNNPKFLTIAQSLALKQKAEEKLAADVAAQERKAARDVERRAKAARKAESARTAQEVLRVAALARAERPNPAPNPARHVPTNLPAVANDDKQSSKPREKKSRRDRQAVKPSVRTDVLPTPQITRGYPTGFAPIMMQAMIPTGLPPPLLLQPNEEGPIVAPTEPVVPVCERDVAEESRHVADEGGHVAEVDEEHVASEGLIYEDAVAEHFAPPLDSEHIEAAFVEETPGALETGQAMLEDEQPDPTGDFSPDLVALYPPEVVPYVDPQNAYPGYEQTEGYGPGQLEVYNPNGYAQGHVIYEPHPGAFYAHDPYYGTYQVAQEGYPQSHVPYQYAAPEYQPGYPAHPDPYGHLAPVVHPVGAYGIQAPPIPYGAPVYGPVQPTSASPIDSTHVTYQQQMYNMQVYGTPYDPSQWPAPPPQ